MKVQIAIVPPGGGETDYWFEVELPTLPSNGDYIRVVVDGTGTTHDFIVRRRWFGMTVKGYGTEKAAYSHQSIMVEVEFALSADSSDSHKRACAAYEARGKKVQELQASCY